jgi:hypothetical protein
MCALLSPPPLDHIPTFNWLRRETLAPPPRLVGALVRFFKLAKNEASISSFIDSFPPRACKALRKGNSNIMLAALRQGALTAMASARSTAIITVALYVVWVLAVRRDFSDATFSSRNVAPSKKTNRTTLPPPCLTMYLSNVMCTLGRRARWRGSATWATARRGWGSTCPLRGTRATNPHPGYSISW